MSLYTSLELNSLNEQGSDLDLLEVKIFAWEYINDESWSLFSWYGDFEIKGNNAKILNVNPSVDFNNEYFSAEINNDKNKIENLGITGDFVASNEHDKFLIAIVTISYDSEILDLSPLEISVKSIDDTINSSGIPLQTVLASKPNIAHHAIDYSTRIGTPSILLNERISNLITIFDEGYVSPLDQIKISGNTNVGDTLSIDNIDLSLYPINTFNYSWQILNGTWQEVGDKANYVIKEEDDGKLIRALVTHIDADQIENKITESIDLPKNNIGSARYVINGFVQPSQELSVKLTEVDPDGTANSGERYSWRLATDENDLGNEISKDSTYLIKNNDLGLFLNLIISYTDLEGFAEEVTLSVGQVTSLTTNPKILGPSGNAGDETSTKSLNENNTTVHTFIADETVTWSLSGGADSSKFSIDSSSGALTFSSAPDYESAADSDSGNDYVVTVRATDSAGNTSDQTLTVSVDDSHELDVSSHQSGTSYSLEYIRDYDGNLHANTGSVSDATKSAYKYQGLIDVNADGTKEAIYTNKESGRWVTASVDSVTGEIDYSDHGQGGTTRVVGIYIDPLVTSGEVTQGGPHDSQRRFQNDLEIDNLIAKTAGDYDGDGFQEVYWKTNDGTAYLRALMHADGNIQYANYQNEAQMTEYLTDNGHSSVVSEVV